MTILGPPYGLTSREGQARARATASPGTRPSPLRWPAG